MKFVNLTPHKVVLQNAKGERTEIPPSGTLARVASKPGQYLPHGGDATDTYSQSPVPIHDAPQWGAVEGVPPPEEGTIYIVSALVTGRLSRPDVVAPGTGPNDGAIRFTDGPNKGQVDAVTRLNRG